MTTATITLMITGTITTTIIEVISAWPAAAWLLLGGSATAIIFARRRAMRSSSAPDRVAELRSAEVELQVLSREVENRFSRHLSQLDRLIVAGDHEIARLRTLAAANGPEKSSLASNSARQPDLVADEPREIIPFARSTHVRKRAA